MKAKARIYSFNTHLLPNLILFAIRNTTLLIILIYEGQVNLILIILLAEGWGPFGPPALFSETIIDILAPY